MSLRNVAELQAYLLAQVPTGGSGNVFAVNVRNIVNGLMESVVPQSTAISYVGAQTSFPVTGTYQKLTTFNTNGGPTPEALLTPDQANNKIDVTTKCALVPFLSFNGQWGTTQEVFLQMRYNDVAIAELPEWVQNGAGAGNPFDMFKGGFIRDTSVISAGNVSLWIKASAAFSLLINKLQMSLEYVPFSIVNP